MEGGNVQHHIKKRLFYSKKVLKSINLENLVKFFKKQLTKLNKKGKIHNITCFYRIHGANKSSHVPITVL